MRRLIRKGDFGWLPTVVVLTVVVLAGSRLIYLSVQHHAAVARQTAATVAASFAAKIEPQLQRLAELAARQAGSAKTPPNTEEPLAQTFWMTAAERVLSSRSPEAARAQVQAGGSAAGRGCPAN